MPKRYDLAYPAGEFSKQGEPQGGFMFDRKLDYWEIIKLEEEQKLESTRFITEENLLSIEQLFKRWPGANEDEVIELERTGKLWPFLHEKTLINPQSFKPTHWLQPTQLISNTHYQNEDVLYNYTACVFLEKNIVEIEKDIPEFLWKKITDKITDDEGIKIFKWPVEYNESQDFQQISILKQELDRCRKQLADRQQEIMELKEKLAAYENEVQGNARTDKANLARVKKDLEAWKAALSAMLEVYRQCLLDGEKERTEDQIEKMFIKNGFEIGGTMLKAFKKAIDQAYVKTTPGASRQ